MDACFSTDSAGWDLFGSYRYYPVSSPLLERLEEVRQQQEANIKRFGADYHFSDYIFTWKDGRPYTGYGLFIVEYKIDDNYELRVGGAMGKPMYARLIYDGDEYVDIRAEDVEGFISEHS